MYANNQLFVTQTTNEDGADTYEFKDKQGQVVLKRSVLVDETLAETYADTYYVYDDFGLLRFVISPEGSAQITTNLDASLSYTKKYVYCYKYDARKRLIEKQVPGKNPEYYVYDKTDKVVLYQDGNMRKYNGPTPAFEWMFTKYDALGRVIMTGVTTQFPNQTRDVLQTSSDGSLYKCWEFISYSGTTRPGDNVYYSNQVFPAYISSKCTLFTLNYYDSYNVYLSGTTNPVSIANSGTLNLTLPATPDYQADQIYLSGKPTVNFVRYNSIMLASVTYYDIYGRTIQTCAKNQAVSQGYDRFTNYYKGLTTQILKTDHQNFVFNAPYLTLNEATEFTYDAFGRPLSSAYTYNRVGPVRNITYSYTPLGQVKTKVIKDDAKLMQTVDYTYNIRGWLTKINDPATLGTDVFGMELLYNTKNTGIDNDKLFTGNISATIWQTAQPTGISTPVTTGQKAYKYGYDKLNRLLAGNYYEVGSSSWSNTAKYSETIVNIDNGKKYDLNGNIQGIVRFGLQSPNSNNFPIDLLKYTYNGNQLIAVDDNITTANGGDFLDNGNNYGLTHTAEYAYDANGNLIKDLNKGIIFISYNYLNQPLSIVKTGGNLVVYTYDASGTKRSQQEICSGSPNKTTDFYANFVYENGYPAWVTYDEGRVVLNNNGTALVNEAYLKDHLGNIRATYYLQSSSLKTQQVNSYYPFGMNIKGLTANGSATYKPNEYLYNGKMMQDEMGLGWLDYGARFYDAVTSRWLSPDPLAEERSWASPYSYCQNNPIIRIDPSGALDDWYENNETGEIKWFAREGEQGRTETIRGQEWTNLGSDLLKFEGNKLTYFWQTKDDNDNLRLNNESWNAVAGKAHENSNGTLTFDYSKRSQNTDNGPIPEGLWSVQKSEVQYWNDQSLLDKAKNYIGGGEFPSWQHSGLYSWGENRWWIKPNKVSTERLDIKGFTIHGGAIWGSHGCIDLTHFLSIFTSTYLNVSTSKNTPLWVDYSRTSSFTIQKDKWGW